MYLITEIHKKGVTGGKYYNSIYYVDNAKNMPKNITKEVAKEFNLEYKNWKIVTQHGSGTGFIILRDLLQNENEEVYLID